MRVVDPGYWSHETGVSTEDAQRPIPVAAHRRTSLELEVRDAQGLARAGVPVELVSLTLGEAVSAWIAAGRVEAGGSGLVSDPHGRLRLEGLPEGRYAWTVTASTGEAVTGACTAVAGGGPIQLVRVP